MSRMWRVQRRAFADEQRRRDHWHERLRVANHESGHAIANLAHGAEHEGVSDTFDFIDEDDGDTKPWSFVGLGGHHVLLKKSLAHDRIDGRDQREEPNAIHSSLGKLDALDELSSICCHRRSGGCHREFRSAQPC